MKKISILAATILMTAGCVTTPTHDKTMSSSLAATSQGRIEDAITDLDNQMLANKGKKANDFLLNLEKAELLRLNNKYPESLAAFDIADAQVKLWESTAKTGAAKLGSQIGATLLGDSSRQYEGQDYEKVMLSTRMAMDRLSMGDLDNARVDIKRTHEREAVIAEVRAKELAKAEAEAKSKGATTESKELTGYPVETLNDPEVLKLRNGYQNALSHYLSGFVYEVLDEPSLSAPGYRKAIELRPGYPVLEDGLAGLDKRTSFRRQKGVTDVLFIIEADSAPARVSKSVTIPVPTPSGLIMAPFSFPSISPDANATTINSIQLGAQTVNTALITDFNVMARRALKDELPGIQMRAATRAIAKGAVQNELNKKSPLLGLLGNVATAATEGPADDRIWRSLPSRVFVARTFIEPGEYDLQLPNMTLDSSKLSVDGRYMVVTIRSYAGKSYFGTPVKFGKVTVPPVVPPKPEVKAKVAKPVAAPASTPATAKPAAGTAK